VLHGDLKCLYYHLIGMQKLSPKIQEVMEFQLWLIFKLSLETGCIDLFGPLKQILLDLSNFCRFENLYKKSYGTISILRVWSNSIPINCHNLLTESIGPHYIDTPNLNPDFEIH
jgi:hypothetical protein